MPEGFTDFSVSPLDSPFVELVFTEKTDVRLLRSMSPRPLDVSWSVPVEIRAICQMWWGKAKAYGVYLGMSWQSVNWHGWRPWHPRTRRVAWRTLTMTYQDTARFFCELFNTIISFHWANRAVIRQLGEEGGGGGGRARRLENQRSTTVLWPEMHIHSLAEPRFENSYEKVIHRA